MKSAMTVVGQVVRSLSISILGVVVVGTMALSLPMQRSHRDPNRLIPPAEAQLAQRTATGLIWPTTGTISQPFHRYHEGLDIAGPIGTPILAAQAGEVILAGWDNWGLGYAVELRHPDGSRTVYGHNSRLLVSVGQWVEQGQIIAEMGSTGNSTGPHLHFEYYPDSVTAQNPLTQLPALVAGRIPTRPPQGDRCPGTTLINGETQNFRVQICQISDQLWYFGQAKLEPYHSIWLPAVFNGSSYQARNGQFIYQVDGDRLQVFENQQRIRQERLLRSS
ncbi:M23 family metallopeptidase [Spirulina major]|uniref:M23 family metallopeptidase n=2 Tax=Spirulinaceae TaxID=1890448 RepID=UPI00233048CD|nr:M23 family metallopeptidase [Spirulina major]